MQRNLAEEEDLRVQNEQYETKNVERDLTNERKKSGSVKKPMNASFHHS